jgi:serine/threonine protein kinase
MAHSMTHETVTGDPEFANLLEELTQRLQSSGGIDLEEYLQRFSQYADQLEQLVPAMQTLIGLRNEAGGNEAGGNGTGDSEVGDSAIGQAAPRTALPLGSAGGTLGDFRIIREIGRGGMGVVYEAEQLSLRRRMALKVLPFAGILDEQVLKRFKNESLAAATLDHPNIVQVHSVGCDRGVHYYAMQLIEGQSLAETITELRRIRKRHSVAGAHESADVGSLSAALAFGRLSPQENDEPTPIADSSATGPTASPTTDTRREIQAAVSTVQSLETRGYFRTVANLGLQAAEALNHAHANGILHRDIKPGNLLLDGKGKLWVTDFGLARIEANAPMTMTGDMLGTLRYMCPESAAGGRERLVVDQRADIYSLGVTLYELLTLQPAFEGRDPKELIQKIIFAEPRPPRQITKAIPGNLETIVLNAMRKDPSDRYATAGELAADLQRFLNDLPIRAKPPTLVDRTRMWSRNNRTLVAAPL